jgi:hypothetical protein
MPPMSSRRWLQSSHANASQPAATSCPSTVTLAGVPGTSRGSSASEANSRATPPAPSTQALSVVMAVDERAAFIP